MPSRTTTKEASHFLVVYKVDNAKQVRTRGFFKTKTKVVVGRSYKVQWGSSKQVDEALVLAEGTKREMDEQFDAACAEPAPKRKRQETEVKRDPKKAKVVRRVEMRPIAELPTVVTTAPTSTVTMTTLSQNLTPETTTVPRSTTPPPYIATTTTSTPLTTMEPRMTTTTTTTTMGSSMTTTPIRPPAVVDETPTPFRPDRPPFTPTVNAIMDIVRKMQETVTKSAQLMNKSLNEQSAKLDRVEGKVDAVIARMNDLQPQNDPTTPPTCTSEMTTVPTQLPDDVVKRAVKESNSGAHFGALLLPVVFPELFGPNNLRKQYNWNGTNGKQELHGNGKDTVKSYVNYYFPETRSAMVFHHVVNRMNERLRRTEFKKRTDKENQPPVTETTPPTTVDTHVGLPDLPSAPFDNILYNN